MRYVDYAFAYRGVEGGDMIIHMLGAAGCGHICCCEKWPRGLRGHGPTTDLGTGTEGQKEEREGER